MNELTARERIHNLLHRLPVDRASFHESLWGETIARWTKEGRLEKDENIGLHFQMELAGGGWINMEARMGASETIEEDEETRLVRNGNGAVLRWWKNKAGTPEHVDFAVRDRAGWDELIVPYLKPDRSRVDFDSYRQWRADAAKQNRFFAWTGVSVFECMHPTCGHEYMLLGMVDDPDWVRSMADTYADVTIQMWEMLFGECGLPDGIMFYEDMGFKERPFMSPAMYRELIQPAHTRLCGWAHERGLKVIVHSCGMIEELVPGMIEAGMDMLQAMEVKAGMDMVRLNHRFGHQIGFFGNIDIRELISNDRNRVDAELRKKILPLVETRTPYILSSDHSTPPEVDYDTFLYFRDRGLELSQYGS